MILVGALAVIGVCIAVTLWEIRKAPLHDDPVQQAAAILLEHQANR